MAVPGRALLETALQVLGDAESSCGQDAHCSAEVSAWRQLLEYLRCTHTRAGTEVCPKHSTNALGNAGMYILGGDLHLNRRKHKSGG